MARNTIALRVLIASPTDVEREREILAKAIDRWNAANSASMGVMLELSGGKLTLIQQPGIILKQSLTGNL